MPTIETGDVVARRWAKQGYSFGVGEGPVGDASVDAIHEADEIIYMVAGRLLLEMGDTKTELAAGEEAMIPGQTRHSARNIGMAPARWYYGFKRAGAGE